MRHAKQIVIAVLVSVSQVAAQWVQTNGPYSGRISSLGMVGDDLFAGTIDQGVFRSSNAGASWAPVNDGLTSLNVMSILAKGSTVYVGTNSGIFRSTDLGSHWSPANGGLTDTVVLALANVCDSSGVQEMLAGTREGKIYISRDEGRSWSCVCSGPWTDQVRAFLCIPGRSGGTILFAGTYKGIFRSTDGGNTWTADASEISYRAVLSFALKDSTVYAGTASGEIFYSSDEGTTWAKNRIAQGKIAGLICFGSSLMAGVRYDGVYVSTDGGTTWGRSKTGLTNPYISCMTARGTTLYVGTESGGVYTSTDKGSTWRSVSSGFTSPASPQCFAAADDAPPGGPLFVGTYEKGVFRTSTGGYSWKEASAGLTYPDIRALCAFRTRDQRLGLLAATSLYKPVEVFFSSDEGGTWSTTNTSTMGSHVTAFARTRTAIVAGTEYSGLFRSTDDGATWLPVLTGVKGMGVKSLAVLSPPTGGTILFAATSISYLSVNSGLYRSTDDGITWSPAGLQNSGVNHIVASGTRLCALTSAAVYFSSNSGTSWFQSYPGSYYSNTYDIAAAPSRSTNGIFFAVHGSQGVLVSTSGGLTWVSINANLPGPSVVALYVFEDEVYAATSAGLWKRPMSEILGAQGTNLIVNSGFEKGTDPWIFFTDGSGNLSDGIAGPKSPHAGQVTITTSGTNVQLFQAGIHLKAGVRYQLTFNGRSSTGHPLCVYLHRHSKPFTSCGVDGWQCDLGTSWKTWGTEFTAVGFPDSVDDARLRFWFAPYARPGDQYFIDDVALQAVEPNLITNGGFTWGVEPWRFYTDGKGVLEGCDLGENGGPVGRVRVESPGSNVQLFQGDIRLVEGERYALRFNGRAKRASHIGVYLRKNGKPFTSYGLGVESLEIGPSWRTYSMEFTAVNCRGIASDGRLYFWVAPYAEAGDEYYFDKVVLLPLDVAEFRESLALSDDAQELQLEGGQVKEYALFQNYPNPFNPTTVVSYQLPVAGNVRLVVYDLLGREVSVLVNGKKEAGSYEVKFDGSNLPSGVYLYRLTSGEFVATKKWLLVK